MINSTMRCSYNRLREAPVLEKKDNQKFARLLPKFRHFSPQAGTVSFCPSSRILYLATRHNNLFVREGVQSVVKDCELP